MFVVPAWIAGMTLLLKHLYNQETLYQFTTACH